ncbi:MAG: hypothetical protein D6808_02875 [Candidatus Dadabacteria bacterium]|nr:MAG: hypothetical protein D6808_02875 [Candidatus Dadabacteria bacterium]
MAEEEEAQEQQEEQEAAEKKKGDKTKAILVAMSASFVMVGLIVLGLFLFNRPQENVLSVDAAQDYEEGPQLVEEGTGDEDALEEDEEPLGAIFPLETFVVNLSGGGFIRVQVQLEFKSRYVPKRFILKLVPLRDAIISLLSVKRKEDLLNLTGKDDLKLEILEVANAALGKEYIENVYFTQFIVR